MAKRFVTTKVEIEGREETKTVELPSRNPAPWQDDAELHVVGQRVPRADALEKVTGQARYTADVQLPGMLHAALRRAPVARGRVTSLDLAPALAMPGVRGAIVMDDAPDVKLDGVRLFDRTIHYANQPLAAVCADSLEIATRAAQAIVLTVEAEAAVADAEQALAPDAPRVRSSGNLHRASPRIIARGDVDAGFRDAEVTIEREYRTPVALHTALEPHGAVADWSAGRVTVWESTQGIFNTRADLADAFGLPLTSVRVIKNYMGGGFGAKNGASFAAYTAVALSRKLGRPVRCIFDREGEQTDAGNRPATIQHVRIGAKRDGTLTAISVDATIALGIGGWLGGPGRIYHELYRCANVRSAETFVFTNTGAMASFRAPGHVEGAFGLECAMDALARELGMDPLELRRRNYVDRDQDKNRPYSAKHLDECYRAGAERFGWDATRRRRRDETSRIRRGVGMASLTWGGGGGPPAYATVRINPDGTIEVLTGAQDLGTGARTVMAQIAAEALGAKVEDVRTVLGDTERLPFASNSWGSITTASVGPAVRVAAEEARDSLFEAAAGMLGANADDLESRDSEIHVKQSDRCLRFDEVCEKLGDVMIIGQGSRGPNPERTALSAFGAQFAEVEVDVETGQVRVLRIVAAHDSGRIINPTLAESQLEGGIIQGVGYALYEARVLDRASALPLNPTMHDYKVPTLADVPEIDAFFVGIADVVANHTGAKGLAEPPIIGVAPAIANAVADAIGADVTEIPLTPWRVLASVQRER
ncbi:MAG TPA: xanthine dehydrogenase family protein molybdopterin-binding subunit [Gemmatimonadaceae bacterium]|nr:xanthine dehydrogenase family protein molybdopterin-binding subunit [Gemmatimonadaceae bacterium]